MKPTEVVRTPWDAFLFVGIVLGLAVAGLVAIVVKIWRSL